MIDAIGVNFRKVECCRFIAAEPNGSICWCGQTLCAHGVCNLTEDNKLNSNDINTINNDHYTVQLPTDAYGIIEFHSSLHPVKAQYIRLSCDTRSDLIVDLLTKKWGLELPKLIVNVQGGRNDFELNTKLKKVLKKGLAKTSKTTGSWIITSGLNSGVTAKISDAFLSEKSRQSRRIGCIGIAPWGMVANNSDLIGANKVVQYSSVTSNRFKSVPLNNRHSCFLLADNGTRGQFGSEEILKRNLIKFISTQRIHSPSHNRIPVIGLIIGGECDTLEIILDYMTLKPPIPIVVCEGSGGIADLIALFYKYVSENNEIIVKELFLTNIQMTLSLTVSQSEKVLQDLMKCMEMQSLITIFRLPEESDNLSQNELDQVIFAALFKSQYLTPVEQLNVAISWNRADIAKNEIFSRCHNLPRGTLYEAMMQSLILDRIEFVKLLLENGICMNDFLTISRLEDLYNSRLGPSNVLKYILKDVKSHIPINYSYNLYDIGLVINKLMGGAYRSLYTRRKFRSIYTKLANKSPQSYVNRNSATYSSEVIVMENFNASRFNFPFNELLVWAVLTKRQKTAMLMWQYGEESLAKSLIACKLYKAMAIEAAEDDLETEIFEELLKYSIEFETLSYQLLDYCYRQDDNKAEQLLTCELTNWSGQTCLSLAVAAENLALLSHPCSQIILADLWLGGLRSRKNTNLKVFLGLIMPLYILKLEFKSKEELQLMPQTEEEYLENEGCYDNNFSDDSGEHQREEHSLQDHRLNNCTVNTFSNDKNFKTFVSKDSNEKIEIFSECCESNMLHMTFDFDQKQGNKLRLRKRIYEFYTAPITKFWFHSLSYMLFLIIYSYLILIKLPQEITLCEFYTTVYLATLFCEKIRRIICSEPVTLLKKFIVWTWNKWNPFDAIAILIHFIGFGLRLSDSQMENGRVLYCVDSIYWFLRIFGILIVSKSFGPLVTMMVKMIKKLMYFILVLFIMLLSYGVCREAILDPRYYFESDILREIVLQPYFMSLGEVFPEFIYPPCGDGPDLVPCRTGRWIVPFVMAVYLMATMVLLMTLIIAYLNNKFVQVNKISHQIWKFQRLSVVMEYEQRPVLPPPFIIISHLYFLYKYLRRKFKGVEKQYDNGLKLFLDSNDLAQLYDFENECVLDYCAEQECRIHESNEERIKQSLEKIENTQQKVDNINVKVNSHVTTSYNVDFRLTKLEDTTENLCVQFNNFHKFMLSHGSKLPSNVRRVRHVSECI